MAMLNDYKIYSVEDVLKIGNPVVPEKLSRRAEEINEYNLLFENDKKKLYDYYLNKMYQYNVFKKANYNPMMIIPNYLEKSTNALLKFTMSEYPIYSTVENDGVANDVLNNYVVDFEFNDKIKQIITRIDVTGNCFVRIIPSLKDSNFMDLQILDTNQVIVISDIMTDEVTGYLIWTPYVVDNTKHAKYLFSEIGKNTYYDVIIENGLIQSIRFEKEEKLPYNDFSVHNFVAVHDYNNRNYGISSYRDLMTLQDNYVIGINTIMASFSRYSAPIMAGPPIVPNGGKESGAGMTTIPNVPIPNIETNTGKATTPQKSESDGETVNLNGKYINIPSKDSVKPEFIQWDGKFEQQMDFFTKFIRNDIGNFSSFPEIVKDEGTWNSYVTSGKALKLKNMEALDKAANYINSIRSKLEKILVILTGLVNNKVVIAFQDGIVDFPDEELEYVNGRISNGTMSRADAIAYLDNVTYEEAQKKVEQIIEENKKNKEQENDGQTEPEEEIVDEIINVE